MRLTSDFWVSALVRRVNGAGGFAAVLRRGAAEAGAVFVQSRQRTGELTLYGPAAQASYDDAKPDERMFTKVLETSDPDALDAKLAREQRFDSDIWVVEIEGGPPAEELLSLTP